MCKLTKEMEGDRSVLTYEPTVDVVTLAHASDEILRVIATTCKYAWGIVNQPLLWEKKLTVTYPGLPLPASNVRTFYHRVAEIIKWDKDIMCSDLDMIPAEEAEVVLLWKISTNDVILSPIQRLVTNRLYNVAMKAPGERPSDIIINLTIGGGHVAFLTWVKEMGIPISRGTNWDWAAYGGHREVIEFAIINYSYTPSKVTMLWAVLGNQLELAKWLYTSYNLTITGGYEAKSLPGVENKNRLAMTKWLYETMNVVPGESEASRALMGDDAELLKWMKELGTYNGPTKEDMIQALLYESENVMIWFISLGLYFADGLIDSMGPCLNVLKCLANWNLYPTEAILITVRDLDVYKWLAEKLDIYPDIEDMLEQGFYDVLLWLGEQGKYIARGDVEANLDDSALIRWMYCCYPYYTFTDEVDVAEALQYKDTTEFFAHVEIYPI